MFFVFISYYFVVICYLLLYVVCCCLLLVAICSNYGTDRIDLETALCLSCMSRYALTL